MEKVDIRLGDKAGGMGTLDYFEEEVTGVIGIVDVIEVAPMLIGNKVATHRLDGLEEEKDGGMRITDGKP